jgi:hypothetical protein
MAVAVFTRYRTLGARQYDDVIAALELDVDPPPGAMLHLAVEHPDGIELCEIWRTRETFDTFQQERLTPALTRHHVHERPEIRVVPLHNLYVPELDAVERLGSVSTPAGAYV